MSDKVFLEINYCNKCPHHGSRPFYTADSFETESTYFCKLKNNKEIGIFDWREEGTIKIPAWCPLREKHS